MEIDFPPINNRIYKKKNYFYPHPYDEDYWNWYPKKASPKSAWKKKRQILSYQVRMYRTWKHNRRTQWK